MTRCAFIGLGVMGYPMAGHLAVDHDLVVFNRTRATADTWVAEHGGRAGETPAGAAEEAEFVAICVGDDNDVRSVVLGETGALAGMSPGSLLVDHTTASAGLARELAEAAAAVGVGFVDAPVSGGQAGAEGASLTIMCGGAESDFDRARSYMESYGTTIRLMGDVGSGQLTKMVNQICIAGVLEGLSEGLDFGRRAGLDLEAVLEVIGAGAAGSWQLANRGSTMHAREFDYGFALDWMHKDLGMALAEAGRNGAQLPVTALVDQFYARLQRQGHGRWDTSALIELLRDD